jgi:mono/diheme cytochrome c family protein
MGKGWFFFVLLSILFMTACVRGNQSGSNFIVYDQSIEIPAEYASGENPYVVGDKEIEAGKLIYLTNCASCHGESGAGDGPAAISLEPAPLDLGERQSELSDAYLYWRIAEGGMMTPFNSVMPAWKNVFSEEQIWQLVTYIRSLNG